MRALRIGQPVWLAESPDARLMYPALRGVQAADVAIIGGGITGTTVAETFASAGLDVALLDAASIGRGSTAASAALLLGELDLGLVELSRRYGARRARRICQLSTEGMRTFVDVLQRLDIPCELAASDSVYYARDAESAERLRQEYRRRRTADLPGEWLTAGALRRLTAIDGGGALLNRRQAHCNPYRACIGLARAAAQAGARLFERSPVRRIDRLRDGVELVTRLGRLRAREVIIATGYATPLFERLVGRFQLLTTYVLATEPISRERRRKLGLGDVMVWEATRPYHYARWTNDGRLLLGGEDRPVRGGRGRVASFRAGTDALRSYFEGLFPGLREVAIDHAWEGLFAMTPDGLPYIGRHSHYPRQLFALGYGGNGMTFASLAARLLLEDVRGRRSPDCDLFAFGRVR